MASITSEQFDAQVEEQKLDEIKWRELKVGAVHKIVDLKFVDTQYGEAWILTLGDETKVLGPSTLINRFKRESNKHFLSTFCKTKRSGAI